MVSPLLGLFLAGCFRLWADASPGARIPFSLYSLLQTLTGWLCVLYAICFKVVFRSHMSGGSAFCDTSPACSINLVLLSQRQFAHVAEASAASCLLARPLFGVASFYASAPWTDRSPLMAGVCMPFLLPVCDAKASYGVVVAGLFLDASPVLRLEFHPVSMSSGVGFPGCGFCTCSSTAIVRACFFTYGIPSGCGVFSPYGPHTMRV